MIEALHPQLALSLSLPDAPSLANFVTGRNDEAVAQIHAVVQGDFTHTALYLWGEVGSGKSHVLAGLAHVADSMVLTGGISEELPEHTRLYLLDDVHLLDADGQATLFHLYNRIRAEGKTLVLTANVPPALLPHDFLPDLKTRLAWDLVYQLQLLTDEDKAQVLEQQAAERGLNLAADVVPYMLRHLTRDMTQLHRVLRSLDEYSLQTKRAVTLPLLKSWLDQQNQ